jgi:hypothetical protein
MSETPISDAAEIISMHPNDLLGWPNGRRTRNVPKAKMQELERKLAAVSEQRDRLAVALDVCLREMLDVIYACNEEIVDANDTFHQAIKLGQKTLDDVKGGSDE